MPIQRITSGILADGAIVAADIADGIVTSSKLADANVTSSKLASTLSISGNFLANNITANAKVHFADSDSSHFIAFQAPTTVSSNVTFILPAADGTSNQVIQTDGSGALSFATPSSTSDKIEEGDSKVEVTDTGSGIIVFTTDNAERMRINSSGNVGIGTDSPDCRLMLRTPSGTACQLNLAQTDVTNFRLSIPASTDALTFVYGASTERARITNGGDFLLGTTSDLYGPSRLQSTDDSATGAFCFQGTASNAGYEVGQIWKTNTSGDNKFLAWITEGGAGTERGSVTYNRAGGLVSYNTSSDYRLKENIIDLTDALETVARLQPRQFTWKETGNTTTGFIAHELAEVLPHAVTGTKDEVRIKQVEVSAAVPATYDENGNELTSAVEAVYEEREVPVYQGVDTSFLVATLTAAIQELKAINDAQTSRIETLEAKVAALETNT